MYNKIVINWQRANSMDAAFVPFVSGYSPSRAINGDTSKRIVGYVKVADILAGMPISKYGNATGNTSGTVEDPSFARTINGIAFTRLVKMEIYANGGDSGAPVYLNQASNGYQQFSLVGIILGGNVSYTLATKVGFILATFNLELYTG